MALTLYKEIGINTESIIQDDNNLTGVAGIMINEKTGENAINISTWRLQEVWYNQRY